MELDNYKFYIKVDGLWLVDSKVETSGSVNCEQEGWTGEIFKAGKPFHCIKISIL